MRPRFERAQPLLHLQRPRERHGDRHLLVQREADEKRQRLLGEEPVCRVVIGEIEAVRLHARTIAIEHLFAACGRASLGS